MIPPFFMPIPPYPYPDPYPDPYPCPYRMNSISR